MRTIQRNLTASRRFISAQINTSDEAHSPQSIACWATCAPISCRMEQARGSVISSSMLTSVCEQPHVGAAIGEQDGHSDEQGYLAPSFPPADRAWDVYDELVHSASFGDLLAYSKLRTSVSNKKRP